MIIGIGIDLAEPVRIEKATERRGARFLERVFTERERATCAGAARPWLRYAGRFAAKEALLKALGTGLRQGMTLQEIETVNDDVGKPSIVLSGRALEVATELGVGRIHLSISDLDNVVAAMVVLETESP
ncbi:MAG: holo-[acyl-carrier-protein] synthase [bacterium]|nr:holo-[acyl-carrier-protein] synthase [bacterium]